MVAALLTAAAAWAHPAAIMVLLTMAHRLTTAAAAAMAQAAPATTATATATTETRTAAFLTAPATR